MRVDSDVATGVGPLLDAAYDEYKLALAENWKAGWVKLMGADKHSTRAYLAQPPLEIEVSGQKILAVEGLE